MPIDFYVTFMFNVSNAIYDDLNKTSDFWTKLSPAFKLEGRYEVALVNFIIKNTYDVLRKETSNEIKVRPFDFGDEDGVATLDSDDYPIATTPYKEYNNMYELCQAINKTL